MPRKRGSIADLMNALSSGSSSSSSVCGLGTLTSSIRSSFARARVIRASSNFLISVSCIGVCLRHFSAAVAEPLLHAWPQHEHKTDRQDRRRQGPQDEDGVIVIGNHQRLMKRALG